MPFLMLRAAADWEPSGPGGFAPISSRPALSVARLRTATVHLISNQIRLGRMVQIYRPPLSQPTLPVKFCRWRGPFGRAGFFMCAALCCKLSTSQLQNRTGRSIAKTNPAGAAMPLPHFRWPVTSPVTHHPLQTENGGTIAEALRIKLQILFSSRRDLARRRRLRG